VQVERRPQRGERHQHGRDDVAGRPELGQAKQAQPLLADEQRALHDEDEQRHRNPYPGRMADHDKQEQPDRTEDGQVNAP
jgi:hypothetical protein